MVDLAGNVVSCGAAGHEQQPGGRLRRIDCQVARDRLERQGVTIVTQFFRRWHQYATRALHLPNSMTYSFDETDQEDGREPDARRAVHRP